MTRRTNSQDRAAAIDERAFEWARTAWAQMVLDTCPAIEWRHRG